jgi:hypothetical protein
MCDWDRHVYIVFLYQHGYVIGNKWETARHCEENIWIREQSLALYKHFQLNTNLLCN